MWPFNERVDLRFDIEYDAHMSSKIYEQSGYSHILDLLTISYTLNSVISTPIMSHTL